MNWVIDHSYLIPLLPLLGAVIAGFFGAKWLKGNSHWPIWIGVGLAMVMSIVLMIGMIGEVSHANGPVGHVKDFYTWIEAGNFKATAGFFFDPLTAVMLCVVTGVGFLITVFSAGYMKGEEGYFRFFAYLGLFIFSMTCLVMGNNLAMLYLGWEGVGLCSYLLIGYYYERPSAREAAKKAFIVNRIGDFGFGLGIMLSFFVFGTISYFGAGVGTHTGLLELAAMPLDQLRQIASVRADWVVTGLKWIPFLLMLGAFGKSAQFPLYVWLPDAMEGPTPVSALIHAATMVTAGVYMIARCGTLFVSNSAAMMTIAGIGAFTALFAATIALRQFDLKKVFAYSTISQLGYMFIAVGVLAPTAAVFHLVTHAFFKALLFLSCGVVMHAMLGHLDMRKMSGLKKVLPITNWLMLAGCAALAGFPFMSGFFSKDDIIAQTWSHSTLIGAVALFTAFLTAYYTFRLYFQVFQGPLVVPTEPAEGHAHAPSHDQHAAARHEAHGSGTERAEATASHEAVATGTEEESGVDKAAAHAEEHGEHNHEPWLMIFPLIILALGAVFGGLFNVPGDSLAKFLGHSPSFQEAYVFAAAKYDNGGGPEVNPAVWGQPEPAAAKSNEPVIPTGMLVGGAISIAGILLAYWLHLRDRARAEALAAGLQPVTGLLEGKYWIDEIYQAGIIEPLRELGRIFFAIDRIVIDGLIWLVGFIPQLSGFTLKLTVQRGYMQGYAGAMLFGIMLVLAIIFL
jgi:NADH-quinone oxidoreductase subunit L